MMVPAHILDRIKELYGFHSDSELAEHLGQSRQGISNWRHEKSAMNHGVIIDRCEGMDLNYIFNGGSGDTAMRPVSDRIGKMEAMIENLTSMCGVMAQKIADLDVSSSRREKNQRVLGNRSE